EVAAAEAHALGADSLAGADFLSEAARRLFRTADELGEGPRLAMQAALADALAAPAMAEVALAWDAGVEAAEAALALATGPVRLRRAPPPAGFALTLPSFGEARAAAPPEPGERIVERV